MNSNINVSQLVISCIILDNQSHVKIYIDKKSFENVDLTVSENLCKIDITALCNIKQKNVAVLNGIEINIIERYYTKNEIITLYNNGIDFTTQSHCLMITGNTLNFSQVPDLMNMLKLLESPVPFPGAEAIPTDSADFSNGLNCIHIYSNLIY